MIKTPTKKGLNTNRYHLLSFSYDDYQNEFFNLQTWNAYFTNIVIAQSWILGKKIKTECIYHYLSQMKCDMYEKKTCSKGKDKWSFFILVTRCGVTKGAILTANVNSETALETISLYRVWIRDFAKDWLAGLEACGYLNIHARFNIMSTNKLRPFIFVPAWCIEERMRFLFVRFLSWVSLVDASFCSVLKVFKC